MLIHFKVLSVGKYSLLTLSIFITSSSNNNYFWLIIHVLTNSSIVLINNNKYSLLIYVLPDRQNTNYSLNIIEIYLS